MAHQTNYSNLFNPIQKITIENFQSHAKTELVPAGPGQLTVIVGQSRQGKTAIFRALRWLFYNAPDGDDFIRWGCTFARVTVEYADGSQVIRYRTSGGTNRYIIRKPGSQEQVYEGFGRGVVPLEVQQVTGVSPVEIGEGLSLNLNLAEQLDGPFLGNKAISSTGRAKVLGKLAGTEEVDLAAKQLGTDLYRWKRDQEACEREIRDIEQQLREYDYLSKFKANMDRLAAIRDVVKAAMERRDKLAQLWSEYDRICTELADKRVFIENLSSKIVRAECAVTNAENEVKQITTLSLLRNEMTRNAASLEAAQAAINKTEGVTYAEEIFKATEGRVARLLSAERIGKQWSVATNEIENVEKVLCATRGVPGAYALLDKLFAQTYRRNTLAALHDHWTRLKENMEIIERQRNRTEKIGQVYDLVLSIEENIAKAIQLTSSRWAIKKCEEQIQAELVVIKNAEVKTEGLMDEYYKVLKRSGKCPYCGGEISPQKIKEVV